MDEHRIHVICFEHLAMIIDVLQNFIRAAANFREQKNLLAGESLDRFRHPVKGPVALGAIEIGDTLVIRVADEPVELRLPDRVLHISAVAAGAEPQPAELQAGAAQGHLVGGGAPGGAGEAGTGHSGCEGAGRGDGGLDEVTAAELAVFHNIMACSSPAHPSGAGWSECWSLNLAFAGGASTSPRAFSRPGAARAPLNGRTVRRGRCPHSPETAPPCAPPGRWSLASARANGRNRRCRCRFPPRD